MHPGQGCSGDEEVRAPTLHRKQSREEEADQEANTVKKIAPAEEEAVDAPSLDGLGRPTSIPKLVHALRNPKLSMDRLFG